VSGSIDRRHFLRMGTAGMVAAGVAGSGGLSALLAACGSSKKSPAAAPAANLGSLAFQQSWINNDEFSGEYIAYTKGYYQQQGLSSVTLLTGGSNVSQDAVVDSGKAFIGVSSPDITGAAINQGADLIIVGAQYQKNPFAIMSLAKAPIYNPQQMIGKTIGVQPTNQAVWNAFLKANNIAQSAIKLYPAGFDPLVFTTGVCDGWFSFITNEPNVLEAAGYKVVTFLLNDYNYPLVSETYMVQTSALTTGRNKLKAFLRAEIMGWHDSIANPMAGPVLAVTKFGKNLGLAVGEQTLESMAQNNLILTAETKVNGIFTISPASITESIHTLSLGGTTITAAKLFDTSVIDEIYQEDPSLKPSPVPNSLLPTTTTGVTTTTT